MIAVQQNFRDRHPAKIREPRVMRAIKQAVRKRIVFGGGFASQSIGQKPDNRVRQYYSRRLAARKYVIAYRYLVRDQRLIYSFIDALVTSADQKQSVSAI